MWSLWEGMRMRGLSEPSSSRGAASAPEWTFQGPEKNDAATDETTVLRKWKRRARKDRAKILAGSTPCFSLVLQITLKEGEKRHASKRDRLCRYHPSGINKLRPCTQRYSTKRSCDASYVGQTGRLLKTRLAEHRTHQSHQ